MEITNVNYPLWEKYCMNKKSIVGSISCKELNLYNWTMEVATNKKASMYNDLLLISSEGGSKIARREDARDIRINAAIEQYNQSQGVTHPTNGDEQDYNNTFIGNYSKGFRHNGFGEVNTQDYSNILIPTVTNEDPTGFVNIPPGFTPPAGSGKKYFKLTNPVSGLAFDLEGPDSHALSMPPPPKLRSEDAAAEMAELYWMAILRDVDFRD
jgi:hypothetical protein